MYFLDCMITNIYTIIERYGIVTILWRKKNHKYQVQITCCQSICAGSWFQRLFTRHPYRWWYCWGWVWLHVALFHVLAHDPLLSMAEIWNHQILTQVFVFLLNLIPNSFHQQWWFPCHLGMSPWLYWFHQVDKEDLVLLKRTTN